MCQIFLKADFLDSFIFVSYQNIGLITITATINYCYCLISSLPLAFDWQIHLFTVSENVLSILTQPIFKIKNIFNAFHILIFLFTYEQTMKGYELEA